MRYLRTNEIVTPRTQRQGAQLDCQVRAGIIPNMLIVRDEAGSRRPDIRSYTAALRQRTERARLAAGAMVEREVALDQLARIHTAPSRDLRHIVRDASADPSVHSIVVMSPTEEDYERIVAEIDPEKDVDGMNPASGIMPCTPVAVQEGLEHHGLWRPDLKYTLVGRGRTVGSHLIGLLQRLHGAQYDNRVRVISRRNEQELPEAMAVSDVAVVAAGVRHQIKPDMVHDHMQAVVGVCIEDIDPNVYQIPGDVLVTPRHMDPVNWGIGIDTSSIAVQRTLDAAAPASVN